MKNKFLLLVLSSIILISIMSLQVSAFFPITHKHLIEQSLIQPIESDFYRLCAKYPDLCWSGNILTDVTVVFYYSSGILYSTSHQPPFCSAVLNNVAKIPGGDSERLMACAVGICSHQSSDLPSHSDGGLVQYSIQHSFLVNNIIHTFSEQAVDSYIERKYPTIKQEMDSSLVASYRECQPLIVMTLLGESAYQSAGLDEAKLNAIFDDFISEIVSGETGYDPSFKNKNFLGTLNSIPFAILGGYIVILLGLFLITILLIIKIFRRKAKVRHYIGLIIFLPIFIIMLMLFIGAMQGNAFKTFVFFIKPISELVPIGNPETYLNKAILNIKQLFLEGETALIGTDASGRGTNPVLDVADSQVMYMDYIIFGVLGILLILFIWFLFKKEKIKSQDIFKI